MPRQGKSEREARAREVAERHGITLAGARRLCNLPESDIAYLIQHVSDAGAHGSQRVTEIAGMLGIPSYQLLAYATPRKRVGTPRLPIAVRLSPEACHVLADMAQKRGTDISTVVRRMIAEELGVSA